MINKHLPKEYHSVHHQSGFTLIELMIVLVLIAIVATVAVPAFNSLISSNQVAGASNNLMAAMQRARSDAVKTRGVVTVCSRTNPRTVPETCSGNTNWNTGWLVFADADNSGTFNAGDELLVVEDSPGGAPTFTGTTSNVRFLGGGLANAAATFTITPQTCKGNKRRVVSITITGVVTVAEAACP